MIELLLRKDAELAEYKISQSRRMAEASLKLEIHKRRTLQFEAQLVTATCGKSGSGHPVRHQLATLVRTCFAHGLLS